MGGRRKAYRILVGRPEGRRLVGRPRRRWEDITVDLNEVGSGGAWTGLNWLRVGQVANSCKRGNEHSGSIERGKLLD
jgi:hypothetical protein